MEPHEIRYFLALAASLNFTRAAEACNVTQPALTRAIRALEEKLGGPLVHRERGNTHLTELGRLMRPYFEAMQATMDAARQRAEAFLRLDDTPLRVGIMCTIGPGRLIGLVRDFISRHPGIELLLRDGPVAKLETALETGEIDVAIASRATPTPYELAAVPLYSEGFLIAVGPGHPLARLNEVHLRDLCGHRYLARSNCEYDTVIDRICSAAGVDLAVAYESERDDWVQSMVMAGLGITLIPEYSVSVPGLVTRRVADLPVRRRIELQTVRGRPHGPAVGAFVGACRSHRWDEPRAAAPGRRPDVAA